MKKARFNGFPPVSFALVALLSSVMAGAAAPVNTTMSSEQPVVRVLKVSGTVTSPQFAVLSPSVGGLIERIAVDAGDRVESGAVMVTLDSELGALALERARAEETEARTSLEDTRRRLSEAERIGPRQGIPESDIRALRAEVASREAALSAATAAAREQEAVVRRHVVRAPFNGVVNRRLANLGEWVNPGDGLFELVATEGLRFDFQVPQNYFNDISRETLLDIRADALSGTAIEGRVAAIVPVKDPGARTFLLRAVATSDLGTGVTPGMSVRASIRVDSGHSSVVVPRDALLRYPDGRRTVWIVRRNGDGATVSERQVKTGLEFDGLVEITEGIGSGVELVVRGNESLIEGQSVSIG